MGDFTVKQGYCPICRAGTLSDCQHTNAEFREAASGMNWSKHPDLARPGTFEWALIQMKAGKKVTRESAPLSFLYIQQEPGDHQGYIVERS